MEGVLHLMGMPTEGAGGGATVTFAGPTGCVGTLESPDRITGTCSCGCTFELYR